MHAIQPNAWHIEIFCNRPYFTKQRGVTDTLTKHLSPEDIVGASLNFGCIGGHSIQQDGIATSAQRQNIKTDFVKALNDEHTCAGFYIASPKEYMVRGAFEFT